MSVFSCPVDDWAYTIGGLFVSIVVAVLYEWVAMTSLTLTLRHWTRDRRAAFRFKRTARATTVLTVLSVVLAFAFAHVRFPTLVSDECFIQRLYVGGIVSVAWVFVLPAFQLSWAVANYRKTLWLTPRIAFHAVHLIFWFYCGGIVFQRIKSYL